QEMPVGITLTGSDNETDAGQLRYIIVNGPQHGRLTGTGSELTYTPDNGYTGTDSFTFKTNDSESDSAPAVITVQVRPLNPLDGWVGSRAQGETSPYVIVTPGSPMKLSAVSALSAERVVATVNGVQVELHLNNAVTAEADGKKVWSNTQFRLSDAIAAGDYKAVFVAYDAAGHVTQEEKAERQLEDNAYHVRTEVNLLGKITDQKTKQPIAGALVTLYDLTGTVKIAGPFTTEADGKYHFDQIRTGEYLIVIKSDGYGTRSSMLEALPTDLVSTVIERNYELVRFNLGLTASPSAIVGDGVTTSKLTAVLKDKDGKPIAGVEVEFSAPRGSFVDGTPGIHLTQKAITDAQGVAVVSYRSDKIEGILSQNIPVTATVDDQEHQLYAVEQVIVTFQPASIQGIVTNNTDTDGDGRPDPVVGAIVRIVKDFNGDGVVDFSAEAVTGPDGSYSIAIPRGEEDYTVSITKTITLGNQSKTITIEQPARAGTVTGAGGEVFASKKTISGIINTKQPSGDVWLSPPVTSNLKVYLKDAQGQYVLDETTGKPKGFTVTADGVFTATNLTQGEYSLEIRFLNTDGQEIIVNQRKDGSLPKVSVTVDGQLNIQEELIDPYGTITDSQSGQVVEGVHVVLYYADTQRNRDNGVTPNTEVVLPVLTGFAPNDNKNPQLSDIYGKYAYMVYAHTDYYLVATKSGYDTYTSPTISVEKAIVRHDIVMNRPVYTGGGVITPPATTPPVSAPTEVSTNVTIEQSVYPAESEVPVTVSYDIISGPTAEGTIQLELPEGVQVIDLDGGKLEGSAIVWPASSKTDSFHPVLKLPKIDGKEQKVELVSAFVNSKGDKSGIASVILNIVDGEHEHIRYIQGYPDGNFKPNRSLTRAELAAIMARLIGKYDGADPGYKDVDSDFWAYGYIKAVTEAGLFTGYEDNRFLPNQPVSRAELAVVMVRYLGLKTGTPVELHFTDVKGHWAMSSIEALFRNSMITGYENGTYKPSNSIKRVEAVTLINHMLYRGPLHDIEPTFPDVPANYWGFGHIEEASVSHESTYDEQGEEHFIKQIEDQVK
ncbi:S-layer homology domain-containing protein, partial [Paenibacillus kobensis]|uniref:S-layer homology domain-containing protein n=1 Tax=Paenibacillus kobensis TaxID=59841 RepID=UPI00157FBDA1